MTQKYGFEVAPGVIAAYKHNSTSARPTSQMGGQIHVKNPEFEDEHYESFSCSYRGLGMLGGIFIRAAIAYLESLSIQNVSKKLLIDIGILDAANEDSEVVIITNYRLHIESALKLLRSWCREQTGDGRSSLFSNKEQSINESIKRRDRTYEMPIYDSILGTMDQGMLRRLDDMNGNYHLGRIPKTLPPILKVLKLQSLHHYVAHGHEYSYEDAQEFVVFLDKMKPFLEFDSNQWGTEWPVDEEIRAVFVACKPGGKVLMG